MSFNGDFMVKRFLPVIALFVLIGLALLFHYIFYASSHVSTDDAEVGGNIVQVSPRVDGQVIHVYINDNQEVKKGALLLEIDPSNYEARLKQAQADLAAAVTHATITKATTPAEVAQQSSNVHAVSSNVAAAAAQVRLTQTNLYRYLTLFAKDEVSKQQVDQARADAVKAEADLKSAIAQVAVARHQLQKANADADQVRVSLEQVKAAQAQVKQAELNLLYTKIYAPETGRVTNKSVVAGDYLQPGQAVLALVTNDLWVVANFKETQLRRLKVGQPVDIHVDATGQTLKGHINSIQAGTGAVFSLLPPENATGNFVKVVQRIPVKITLDNPSDAQSIAPGMSVVPVVITK